MSISLFLDCSTANSAWAFIEEGKLLAGGVESAPPSASVTLADRFQKLFAENKALLDGLKAVYVASGPGSFTGLRVALALGKGIAYASNAPLIGFSSMESIAAAALVECSNRPQFVAATIDAKKHEIYGALYRVSDEGLQEVIPAGAYGFEDFKQQMTTAVGGGSLVISGTGTHLVEVPGAVIVPVAASAAGLLQLSAKYSIPEMSAGELYNSWNLRPFYARLSEAELGLLSRKNNE